MHRLRHGVHRRGDHLLHLQLRLLRLLAPAPRVTECHVLGVLSLYVAVSL